jgi:hypothetical protein
MIDRHTERRAEEGDGYEYLAEHSEIVGRLLWLAAPSDTHDVAGWWLVDVAGKPDEALYRVPSALARDLRTARLDGESSARWFARTIIGDVRSGLLDKAIAPASLS